MRPSLALFLAFSPALCAAPLNLPSPDGSVQFRLDGPQLLYSIQSAGQNRIEPSRAGILVGGTDLGEIAGLGAPETRELFGAFDWRGNKTSASFRCRAYEIPIRSKSGVHWKLEVRVFNDGVAFRYRVPGAGTRKIAGESTAWNFPADATLWYQTDTSNYEGAYHSARADQVPLEQEVDKKKRPTHLGPPVTAVFSDGTYGLVSEAALYNYSGFTLRPQAQAVSFRAVFQDDPEGWSSDGPILSPWRVLILAKDLNGLVNSDVIPALCDPPDAALFPQGMNTPWIKPGKAPCTWMVHGNDGAQWDRQKWWVDMCAATGCEYLLVDAGWRSEKWGWLKDGGNVWERAAELCRYGAERGVGIVLWHAYPEGRDDGPGLTTIAAREELFSHCRKAGVKGVKIDFFDSESKATIDAYEDLLRRSAKHQLMINFHGANKPTGEPRTWPHEITREGIREQEYVLWDSLPLEHYGALPFTRMAAGHADFLPGYVQPKFLKNTTLMFQMAAVVVFSSPFLCWPDNPEAYLDSPMLPFIRSVPVTWDETRILPGSAIGEAVVMARRKGADWHVAVLNCAQQPRSFSLDLAFAEPGGKTVTIYRDSREGHGCHIDAGSPLPPGNKAGFDLRPGGGLVLTIQAAKQYSGWK